MTFYTVTPDVYTTPVFSTLENIDVQKRCCSLKNQGLLFSVNGQKLRLLKTMAWRPSFALHILDARVNNNIMLIMNGHVTMVVRTPVWTRIILILNNILKWNHTSVNRVKVSDFKFCHFNYSILTINTVLQCLSDICSASVQEKRQRETYLSTTYNVK